MEGAGGASRTADVLAGGSGSNTAVLVERVFNLGGVVRFQKATQSFLFGKPEILQSIFLEQAVVGFEDWHLIAGPVSLEIEPTIS